MNMSPAMREFWITRQPRERRMLGFGAALLLLLLIWLLLIDPAIEGRSRWQQALPTLRSQLAQMRAIAAEVAALPARAASASPASPAADFSRTSLERSLKDKGLQAQTLTVTDNGVSANFSNVHFAALAEWLQQVQSSAQLGVTEATITTRDLPGQVDAKLNLQRAQ